MKTVLLALASSLAFASVFAVQTSRHAGTAEAAPNDSWMHCHDCLGTRCIRVADGTDSCYISLTFGDCFPAGGACYSFPE